MATTSPDNLRTPDAGDQYALVQDLGAFADTIQTALTRRANSYVGTSAQRTAFTSAPEGAQWRDTNGSRRVYFRQGTSWVAQPIVIAGQSPLSYVVAPGAQQIVPITFGQTLPTTPYITATPNSAGFAQRARGVTVSVEETSPTGFTARLDNLSANDRRAYVMWNAVVM